MTTYYVPNAGPSVQMTPAAQKWVEKIGSRIEKKEFSDLAMAQQFAERIQSTVQDARGKVLWDPQHPDAPVEG